MSNGISDEAIAAYAATLVSYEARAAHSLDRLIPFREFRTYGMDRALVAAGRMFGIGKRPTRRLVKSRARNYKFVTSYADRAMMIVPSVEQFCGYVYSARMVDYPHIIKIGFSRQPEIREKQLSYEAKSPVRMETVELGTLFEEAYRLLVSGRQQINSEWYFDPSLPVTSMPDFLSAGYPLEYWQRAAERSATGSHSRAIGAHAEIYLEIIGGRVH
jgi:hypothetical protein